MRRLPAAYPGVSGHRTLKLILYILLAVATPVLVGRLYRDAAVQPSAASSDGSGFLMTFPRSQWILAWILLLLLVGGPLVAMGTSAFRYPTMVGTMLSIAGLPPLAFLWSRRYRVEGNSTALVAHSPWRGKVAISWGSVVALEWARYGDSIRFRGREGQSFSIPSMLRGMENLEHECRKRLAPAIIGDAFAKLYARRRRNALPQAR